MATTDDATRESWSLANKAMTDAALRVARWVELHPAASTSHPDLKPRLAEFVEARAEVLDRIAADVAPAPVPASRHLSLVR